MAQSGYTPILIYASGTATNVPLAANMTSSASGAELGLNYADGKLYYKNSSGVVTLLASATTVTNSFSAGTTGLTPNTATTGAVTLAGTLAVANGGTGLTAGTSGGVLAYTATGTLASSTALAASALVIGGGAGAAPSTTTTGTGVVTALGVNTGTAGAFVVNGGALGTPSSGTVTNLTGTASININGTVGATTPAAGIFTYLNSSGIITISIPGTGIPTNLAVNTTAGAANGMSIEARADESSGIRLVQTSTTYNTSPVGASDPPNIASAGTLVSGRGGGLNIVGANGPVRTYSGGAGTATTSVSSTGLAVTGTLSATGNVGVGTTATSVFSDNAGSNLVIGAGSASAGLTIFPGSTGVQASVNFAKSTAASGDQFRGNITYSMTTDTMYFGTSAVNRIILSSTALALQSGVSLTGGISGTGYSFSGSAPANSLTLDASGNLGLGVTPSAWYSTIKALQLGTTGQSAIGAYASGGNWDTGVYGNCALTGNYVYIANGYATRYGQDQSGAHKWYTAASGTAGNPITFTQAMTLDASGRLMVGTTSPAMGSAQFTVTGNSVIFSPNTDGANTHIFTTGAANDGTYAISNASSVTKVYLKANGDSYFTGGKLFLGTTTTPTGTGSGIFNVEPGNQNGIAIGVVTTGNTGLDINVNNTGSYFAYFRYNAANVGSITTNGTITVYNTTSDYRLKTVVGAVSGQGARIDALQPIEYTWNSNGSRTRGFLAHQFQEVYASSVTGTKDAVDADGKPVYQAMQASTSEVIADLVAELQSLRARVAQLESKP